MTELLSLGARRASSPGWTRVDSVAPRLGGKHMPDTRRIHNAGVTGSDSRAILLTVIRAVDRSNVPVILDPGWWYSEPVEFDGEGVLLRPTRYEMRWHPITEQAFLDRFRARDFDLRIGRASGIVGAPVNLKVDVRLDYIAYAWIEEL